MKVALIQPNSPFLTEERVFPNIGVVRVATQLEHEGHKVDLFDYTGKKDIEIKNHIQKNATKYDAYGFSSTTPQFLYTTKIFNYLKDKNKDAYTILGGAHASALYNLKQKGYKDFNIDDLENFNTIFAGEGELDNVDLMFKNGWQKGKLIKNIDDVLEPDRSLIDEESYHYNLFGKDTLSIQTQRGCPFDCAFCCGRDIEMYNKVRQHSPERVLKEMDDLHEKYGRSSFMWYDDEININMNRLEKLCGALSKRNYQHRGFIRSDQIVKHPESVEWMKEAGFVKLCTGVESGSDNMLKKVNKKTTSEMNYEARKIIKKNKIHYESFLMLGFPGEGRGDVLKTINWIKNAKPDDYDVNIITPYPGSKIYDEAVPSTTFKNYKWEFNGMFFNKPRYSKEDSFYKGIDAQSESNVRTTYISNKELKKTRDLIDRRFK